VSMVSIISNGSVLGHTSSGYWRTVNKAAGPHRLVGLVLLCRCETDIFAALCLPYIPMHMRSLVG
jgi:hypothetical protein